MPKRNTYVVKFGGSIFNGPLFLDWVEEFTRWSKGRNVYVVPGGGAIAEALRSLQHHTGFDDLTAHELALISMRQLGMIICACSGERYRWSNLENLNLVDDTDGPVIWVPSNEEFELSKMPKNWSVSSDSIALWLADRVGANELVLLKSIDPPGLQPERWSSQNYVDSHFEVLLKSVSCKIRAVSKIVDL